MAHQERKLPQGRRSAPHSLLHQPRAEPTHCFRTNPLSASHAIESPGKQPGLSICCPLLDLKSYFGGCRLVITYSKSFPPVRVFAIASAIGISVICVPFNTTSLPNLPACTRSIAATPYRVASIRSYAEGVPPR